MNDRTGWSRFGAALGHNSTDAYNTGVDRGAQTEAALLRAREARDKEVGRRQLAQQAMESGDTEFANLVLQGGVDPGNTTTYRKGRQDMRFADEAWANATGPTPDLELINRMNAVREGKTFNLSQVQDHTAVNPMLLPSSQNFAPTEIGLAEIVTQKARQGALGASANASNASAENSRASALLHGATMRGEVPGRGGSAGGGSIAPSEIPLLFGDTPDGGTEPVTDQDLYKDFLRFKAERGIANEQQAWALWDKERQARQGAADSLVGDMNGQIPEQLDVPAQPSLLDSFTAKIGMGPKKPGAPQKTAADAVSVASQEDFDKLAPGTMFINPADGRVMRKK